MSLLDDIGDAASAAAGAVVDTASQAAQSVVDTASQAAQTAVSYGQQAVQTAVGSTAGSRSTGLVTPMTKDPYAGG